MSVLPPKARKLLYQTRDLLFPDGRENPRVKAAQGAADAVWAEIFAPLGPLVDDADVLELGGYDGRLSGGLLDNPLVGRSARSAVVIDRQAYWAGEGDAIAWPRNKIPPQLELHAEVGHIYALDLEAFDLILCRRFEDVFLVGEVEAGLARLYNLLRPGGELVVVVGCAALDAPTPDGPGYGFMTPSSWIMLMLRAGFEIAHVRRLWRPAEDAVTAAEALPDASDDERMTAELHCRLIRPWEGWELDKMWSS